MPQTREQYNAYMNDYMKKRYARRRLEAIQKLGGVCVVCGTTERLEFDHIDPTLKDFTMANASSFSEARWQAELSKCQLLCHQCHKNKHACSEPCGTMRRYWRGCRCDQCRAAMTVYNRENRARRKAARLNGR